MDITLLKTFLKVANTRHFGKAANSLHVTQSAVSARIKLLESQLGVQLFHRRRNDIQLTSAGSRLIRSAETIVNGWERARHEIALSDEGTEMVAIGSTLDLWSILIRDWAVFAHQTRPKLVLQIEVQPSQWLVERLVNGLLDMLILFEPPAMSDLALREIAEIPLALVSTEKCSIEEAMSKNYYMVDWGSLFALQHAEYFPDIPSPSARVNSGALALDLMMASGGSAYLARQMVQHELESGRLFTVADAPVIERAAFAIYRPENEVNDSLRFALETLKQMQKPDSLPNK
ncbi:MAG: LysR family transcriptional regulator [Candidatus Thiodiazotropha sp.]|jgi:DNA-binding transcriptional LysR family regulator